jgi:predicted methyltransferase
MQSLNQSIIINFGKHIGKTYEFVRENDVSYCNWVLKQYNIGKGLSHFQQYLKTKTKKVTCECCNGTGVIDQI